MLLLHSDKHVQSPHFDMISQLCLGSMFYITVHVRVCVGGWVEAQKSRGHTVHATYRIKRAFVTLSPLISGKKLPSPLSCTFFLPKKVNSNNQHRTTQADQVIPCWPCACEFLGAVQEGVGEEQQHDCLVTFDKATYGKVSMASMVSSPDPPSI